ncbi:sensor histidine kinase [Poseidonibacter ostreae]|uniref:histidine kinase n=1 Tax=Poseidonibacter ostreae TaxID=2654171 RepID=A0A6L4WNP8_9BACT|nr:HAMP domain-containing sensor histidine kinase [Poseidonibacter ostreae]KAB7885160.1 sensor histidine kinase [Poseidonibacter ostreae]KAB7885746.1 sensor histidine kinase [Poseidonibacter ostreae]KAB7893025.1 sensor histidine kinase [Poseidonibacter ostreae]MAC85010.1 two-component sensor histidine kinase [Arcobacter sp.]
MNKNERKALFSFLSIYVGSAILLISVLLYIYYNNELESVADSCSMEMSNASMHIKSDILNSYMKHKKYVPKKLENDEVRYALYDKDKKVIYSYIDAAELVDFSASTMYESSHYHYYITTLDEKAIPVKYIAIETCLGIQNRNNLKIYVIVALILSGIFIGFIGYLLSKILLKPVRERVEQMDKFIKDSAHELNTPITVLMTSTSMLKNGKNPDKMMRYILSSTKQISQIYNDIHFSAFNEINDDVFEEFNLKELVKDSVEYFNDISITKKIVINDDLEDCFILMDRTKTQKVVNNLISNAIKYSNNNSIVNVVIKDNILSVEDFGIGISEQEQKEIFKRYKRGTNIEGGFGIGLDIVKRISEEYNLKLDLKSQLGQGSTFYIDFCSIINNSVCSKTGEKK